eukprot:1161225-Pelagomonas_calceolata.AAC.24
MLFCAVTGCDIKFARFVLCVPLGQSSSKAQGKMPPCACGGKRKREQCTLSCGNGVNWLPS